MTWTEGLWSSPDATAAEYETQNLLFGLVRMLKPQVVIETGCHRGYTTTALRWAIKENGCGQFFTCDTDKRYAELAGGIHCSGRTLIESHSQIDFCFIDSGDPPYRIEEINVLVPRLRSGGLMCLHDVCRDSTAVYEHALKLGWPHLIFRSVRGLAVFQKP